MDTVADPPPKTNLALKHLARALDPACRDGEAENSAVKFIRCCRREGIGLPESASALAPVRYVEPDDPDSEPPACAIVMPFGRFAGITLGEIARENELHHLGRREPSS